MASTPMLESEGVLRPVGVGHAVEGKLVLFVSVNGELDAERLQQHSATVVP